MTLSDRVINKVPLASVKGHPTHLTQEEEISLKHYITFMVDRGFPISKEVLCYAWCNNGPSLMWWRGLKKRNPDLRLTSSESVRKQTVVMPERISCPSILNY